MNENNTAYNDLMSEVFKTVEAITIDGTIKKLQEAQKSSLILNDADVEFILKCVCNATSVRRDMILNGTQRTDDRKIALCLSMYFIKEYTSIKSFEDLKKVFNKNVSLIHRNIKTVKGIPAKPKTDFDKKMAENFKAIEKLIKEKK